MYVESEARLIVFGGTAADHKGDVWSLEGLSDRRTAVAEPLVPSPRMLALEQSYPNPFNGSTVIEYRVPSPSPAGPGQLVSAVELSVFNLLGQSIRTLVDEQQFAGRHVTVWDGRDGRGLAAAAGVYLYRLEAAGHTVTRKLVLLP